MHTALKFQRMSLAACIILAPLSISLWTHFNGDAVMTTYLLIYIIGHLLSAVLIGLMLGRLRLIPAWAACNKDLAQPAPSPAQSIKE